MVLQKTYHAKRKTISRQIIPNSIKKHAFYKLILQSRIIKLLHMVLKQIYQAKQKTISRQITPNSIKKHAFYKLILQSRNIKFPADLYTVLTPLQSTLGIFFLLCFEGM